MKRQNILVIVFASLLAAVAVAYFAFVAPMIAADSEKPAAEPVDTEEGEVALSDRLFMFGSVSSEDIRDITVKNKYGSYTFCSSDDGSFYIKDHEKLNYNKELFAKLLNITSYTLSKTKVGSSLSDEKLAEYGLVTPAATWTVRDKSGKSFSVLVGDRLLTGGGYYCMLEGRRSVYVLGTDIGETVLCPIEDYVTSVLCAGISKDDYYVTNNFTVYKNGEMLLRIKLVDKKDQINPDALAENIMDYPAAYYPDSTLYYDIIYAYMSLTADSCYMIDATDSDMESVGLDSPAHRITFDYKNTSYELCFSELQDGVYYAKSNLYPDVIGIVDADNFEYLEYDLIDWINPYIFRQYITNISDISVKTGKVSADYILKHSIDEKDNEVLNVNANGTELTKTQCDNFRQYYKSLLSVTLLGYYRDDEYCSLTDAEVQALISDSSNAYLSFSYTTLSGDTTTLCFYRYSTRHSLVTINGKGEFYVNTDLVKKIENDTLKVLNGETVVAHEKN